MLRDGHWVRLNSILDEFWSSCGQVVTQPDEPCVAESARLTSFFFLDGTQINKYTRSTPNQPNPTPPPPQHPIIMGAAPGNSLFLLEKVEVKICLNED